MFIFPKFMQVGLYSTGVNMKGEHVFGMFTGFHIWRASIFCWEAYIRGGDVFTEFYGIRIKD